VVDPRIFWMHEPVPGSAFARNNGLQKASGDWIQFLDVDDLLMPGKITEQLAYATGAAIVSPHLYQYLDGTREPSKWLADDLWEGLLNSGLGSTSSMFWNRKSLLDVGGWSVDYQSHQEYELLFRLASTGKTISCVDQYKTVVRQRKSGSITQQSKPVRAGEGIRLRTNMWKYLQEQSLTTPGRKMAFLQYVFRQLRGLMRTDKEAAMKLYFSYFKNEKFSPAASGLLFYNALYHSIGFRRTEQLYMLYAMIRDKYLPFLPRNN